MNNFFSRNFSNVSFFSQNHSITSLNVDTAINLEKIYNFDKIYKENDIELLRFYLTLYPERLVTTI